MQNGEEYSFEGADSSYMYRTKYMYIAMPLKLYYTYGENFKLLAGGGIVPQMFLGYRQNIEYTNSINETVKEDIKTNAGFNPFVSILKKVSPLSLMAIQFVLVDPLSATKIIISFLGNVKIGNA